MMKAMLPGLAACAAVACAGLPSVERDREPAAIVFHGDSATIEAPDTVAVGATFTVRITTFGGGCVRRTAGTDVVPREEVIEIRPYNHDSGGPICTSDLMFLVHEVPIRAERAGPIVLRVIGSRLDSGASGETPVQLERRIVAH